jgi:23S rRNA (uracil1939-C5)-methyltransferase
MAVQRSTRRKREEGRGGAARDARRRPGRSAGGAEEILELEVTGLSHGPAAIARHDGQVIFVRGAAPGDRVRARVVARKKSYARVVARKKSYAEALVVEVVEPGESRREPPCPHVVDCGGCPWQHVSYASQLAAKAGNVRREIGRLPGVAAEDLDALVADIQPAPAEWGYRQRVRLHVDRRRRLGYQRPRSHAVVPIETCTIAHSEIVDHLEAVATLVAAMSTPLDTVEIAAHEDGTGVVLVVSATAAFAHADRPLIHQLRDQVPSVLGVFVHGPGWAWQDGDDLLPVQPRDDVVPIEVPVTAFSQANPAANRRLVGAMLEAAALESGDRVLELFAGAGNFTAVLAPRVGALRAVERHRRAARTLTALARDRGWRHVEVEEGDVGATLERLLARGGDAATGDAATGEAARDDAATGDVRPGGAPFDLVVADPPRTGMLAESRQLAALRPRRIVYVSCDLPTLVRDLRVLLEAGYRLRRVQPIDLFPQTHHVELVAALERDDTSGAS